MEIIQEKIENWVNNLPSTSETKVIVKSVDKEQFSITLANQHNESQEVSIFFDVEMNPMFLMSSLPEAEGWIHSTNDTLQSQTYNIDDFLDLMKATLSNSPIFNLEPEIPEVEEPDEEYPQYVDATEEDWENIVLPAIKKHIRNDKFLRTFEMEEWIRRVIKQKEDKGIKRALTFFRDEIIQHTPIPKELSKFIPRESFFPDDLPMYSHNGPSGASDKLKKFFHEQLIEIQRSKIPGVIVKAFNDSFHWTIEYSDFSETTQLGNDLMELALLNHDFEKSSNSFRSDVFIPSNKIHPAVITCEMKFKSDFPKSMPYFRLISPTLCYVTDMFFKNELKNLLYSKNEENVNNSENDNDEEIKLENINLKDVIIKLREFIINNDLRVDLTSSMTGNNTMNGLWYTFKTCSPKSLPEFSEIEGSGRIYLPTSLLSDMYSNSFVNLRASNSGGSPMIFEVYNPENDKKVYCGVLEFTSPEGVAILPTWVFENLEIQEPNSVEVRRVSLPKCTFLKIKAHIPEDINEEINVKAMLEWKLRNFLAVSTNQTIEFEERGHIFKFDVLDVKPGNIAAITDLDISVELVTDKKDNNEEKVDNEEIKKDKPKDLTTGYISQPSENTKQCPNCKSFIPLSNYDIHELSCARLNTLCKKCGTVVNKNSMDQHQEEYHSFVECSKCGELIEKMYLLLHEVNQCSHRLVSCKYCEMSIRLTDLSDHEEACGAITEPCGNCGLRIMRRYRDEHINSDLCNKEYSSKNPKPYINPIPSTQPNKLSRSIFVCEKCQQPIEGFDELQVHFLTEHAEEEQTDNNEEEIMNEELIDNNIYKNLEHE